MNLSPREKTLILAILDGKRDKQIAFDLGLTLNTVETYMSRLRCKLNVDRRAGIVIWAFRNASKQHRFCQARNRNSAQAGNIGTCSLGKEIKEIK